MTGNKSVRHTCTEGTKKKDRGHICSAARLGARDGGEKKEPRGTFLSFLFLSSVVNATEFVSQSGHMCVSVLKPPAVETERCA